MTQGRQYSEQSFVDDVLNRGLAGLALVALAPLLGLIAAMLKLSSTRPVLYSEPRVGVDRRRLHANPVNLKRALDLGGKPFFIQKFRTRSVGGVERGEIEGAPLTTLGRVLHRFRLDDLPQLFNVLRGDMRLVGPRPDRPSTFAEFWDCVAEYPLRQRVKPGITGLAQLYQGDEDQSLEDVRTRLRYDVAYIQERGLFTDLKILGRTFVKTIFVRSEVG